MEIEDFKGKIDLSGVSYSEAEIESIFQLRTKSTIKNINRKMLLDALLMIITAILLISLTFAIGLRSRYYVSTQIIGLSLLLLAHYRLKYLHLNKSDFHHQSIREVISSTYRTFKKYWIGYHIVVPLMMASLSIKLMLDLSHDINMLFSIFISVCSGLVGLMVTYIVAKKMYHKEYNKLKEVYQHFEY